MSAVLYTRVPDALKQALTAHAEGRGLSQTLNQTEYLALLGAPGVLTGLALASAEAG